MSNKNAKAPITIQSGVTVTNTIVQRCHASLARFSLVRASLAWPSLACFTVTRSQFGAFQFDAMPVWRVPLWRVSPFCAFPVSVSFNIDENRIDKCD